MTARMINQREPIEKNIIDKIKEIIANVLFLYSFKLTIEKSIVSSSINRKG